MDFIKENTDEEDYDVSDEKEYYISIIGGYDNFMKRNGQYELYPIKVIFKGYVWEYSNDELIEAIGIIVNEYQRIRKNISREKLPFVNKKYQQAVTALTRLNLEFYSTNTM